jgi:hypothetical protein
MGKAIHKPATCDLCGCDIPHANDENELQVNSAKYITCPYCHDEICSWLESHVFGETI